jgi:hypothetical protein
VLIDMVSKSLATMPKPDLANQLRTDEKGHSFSHIYAKELAPTMTGESLNAMNANMLPYLLESLDGLEKMEGKAFALMEC